VLARVAGAAHADRAGVGEGHVVQLRHPGYDGRERLGRARALHREDRQLGVPVGDADPLGRGGREPPGHLGGVGRVGHRQHLVRADEVDDQVVDDPAVVSAAECVLRLPRTDPPQVRGETPVDEGGGLGADDRELAEMADVEDADVLAHRHVLGHRSAGIGDRHRPSAERREGRAESEVPVVQWAGP
jgi:hypothetical protein